MLTRFQPDDANVGPNSSECVDPSSSDGVDTMLTQTPAKLLSVLVPNMSWWCVVRLPQSRIPLEFNTAAIAVIVVIVAIAGIYAVECEISSIGGIRVICIVESSTWVRSLSWS